MLSGTQKIIKNFCELIFDIEILELGYEFPVFPKTAVNVTFLQFSQSFERKMSNFQPKIFLRL